MDICQIALGYLFSTIGGAFALWILIDKVAWPYAGKKTNIIPTPSVVLTVPLGISERLLYTTAIIIDAPELIAVWLVMKVAISWKGWEGEERVAYNIFLIGNVLSIMFGIIGAWVVMGEIPYFTTS